jgi:basic membrane protein A
MVPPKQAACDRERGVRQIGNVGDWVARDPKVFVGSALADVGWAVYRAAADAKAGTLVPGLKQIGLENDAAVRLVSAPDVSESVKNRLARLSDDIRKQRVQVSTAWEGAEFPNPS